jgi:hypothetical protein
MKKLIILSITFLFCIAAKTQEYTPFNFEKGIWITSQPIENGTSIIQYNCKGDTLIDGIKYYKLCCTVPIFGTPTSYSFYYGGIRNNENKQVILNDGNLRILYDFNLKVGDTIINGIYDFEEITPIVQQIDSVQICGIYHKRYKTQFMTYGGASIALTEGIGMNQCLLGFNNIENGAGEFSPTGCYTELGNNNCSDSDCGLLLSVNKIPDLSDEIKIFPSPGNTDLKISSSKFINKISIYDLLGKPIFFISNLNSNSASINIKKLHAGAYLIKLEFTDKNFSIKPFIKN